MTSEELIRQIETYSNAIVAFSVLQGLAYAYSFGTNAFFNCLIKTSSYLAEGLTVLFAVVAVLSVAATVALGRTLRRISGRFGNVVRNVYLGKIVTVVIFSLVPLSLTVGYGVVDYAEKTQCKSSTDRSQGRT